MNTRTAGVGVLVVTLAALGGCSLSMEQMPEETPTAAPSASSSPSVSSGRSGPATPASSTAAPDTVPGYAPGQFPTVPLFSLPDVSRLSTAGAKLRDKLQPELKNLPGVTLTAVRCGKDGNYRATDAGLVLYGKDGSYVGPDGSYTRNADGSEVSVSDAESVTRDGKGGGTYVSDTVSITNAGDGSGSYVSGDVSITLDGKGGGTYVSDSESITNAGDGSGTYVAGDVSITVDADGSGSYVDGTVSITNDGKGRASITGPTFSGEVDAEPLAPVLPLGTFPPVKQVLPKIKSCGFVITLADGVLFDFDSAGVRPDAEATLDALASAMKRVGSQPLRISGHTDAIGTDEYNQSLSERRAASVEQALVQRGVTAPMTAEGFGETKPVAPNTVNGKDNPAGRQLNRRVEIFVRF